MTESRLTTAYIVLVVLIMVGMFIVGFLSDRCTLSGTRPIGTSTLCVYTCAPSKYSAVVVEQGRTCQSFVVR